ncbi:FAD dependent oxidoreductase [Aspergillus crustosus]
MAASNIVVLGAGVSGLTTAYLLSQDPANSITVVAKHMPGEYDIEYCSPWAGADYLPAGKAGSNHARWERETWQPLKEITEKHPEAGIHFQDTITYNRAKDQETPTGQRSADLFGDNPWYKDVMPNEPVPKSQLPPGIVNAQTLTSICINTMIYLPWLVGQCRKNGTIFKRAVFKHVSHATKAHHSGQPADIVVNCTGLSSKSLGGVNDTKLYPARGQVVVVRNEAPSIISISGTDDGGDERCYVMTRAAGGGTILGGTYQKNEWNPLPDANLATRIMKRAIALCPELVGEGQGIEGLDIIRHGVGLRPLRDGGPRIEAEEISGVAVVHNYGHGGFGYQASYGCAAEAVRLVKESLQSRVRAKL